MNSKYFVEEFTEQQKANFRTDQNYNTHDRHLEREINGAIIFTQESYDKMLYADVFKYGFDELQSARDHYVVSCLEKKMNLCLIKRFIEVQAILLAPICPHMCDYIYQFLHPKTSIMTAKWRSTKVSSKFGVYKI